MQTYKLFLNGDWAEPEQKSWIEDVNPATGEVFAHVCTAGEKEVELALEGAYQAKKTWGKSLAKEREKILLKAADYMETSPLGRAEWMKFYGMRWMN